jgi:hypothetical protein
VIWGRIVQWTDRSADHRRAVLIIVPPSETKRRSRAGSLTADVATAEVPGGDGPPVDLDGLSFPRLTPVRRRVIEALLENSARPDAFRRLMVRPSMADEVGRNTWLLELPTQPVLELYAGPLHVGLDAAGLTPEAVARARDRLVIASALWGLLRPVDRIPTYRLHMGSHLVGIDRLDATWRTVVPQTLAEAAGPRGIVIDLRSPIFQAAGMPADLGDRTVTLRVAQSSERGRRIGDVVAKRVRGEATHWLLESGADPNDPDELAAILGQQWPAELREPERPGKSWTLTLRAAD